MLLHRSILLKVCLLLAICLVEAQYEYENEEKEKKEVNEEDDEDERDYAKIFAQETSQALTAAVDDSDSPKQSDFVTPTEFESYFTPAHIFGESNEKEVKASPEKKRKEPLDTYESKKEDYPAYLDDGPLKGFFEESEKTQQKLHKEQSKKDEEVVRPGPSYISHQIPAHNSYEDDDDEDKSTSASEDVERGPPQKNEQKSKVGADFEEGRVEKNDDDYKLPPFSFEPLLRNNKPKVDYNTGKSSSTVSQYPAASGYTKPAASTPYEKYSFQPAEDYAAQNTKFFDSILSTVTPYNPTYKKNSHPQYETQSTEDVPSQLQAKGCRKIESSSSDDMNCFICENPKTNAKYTQCSYSSQKKPVDYYEGNSAKYSHAHKDEPNAYRHKRYADNEENDPYTYIRNRARKASSEGVPSDYSSGFNYEAEHYDESKPELTFSEKHSEEIKKNPENCQKTEKDGMTCTVCKDPKSGGNFEQCSYTSKPKEKKYAYVTEKKYDNDEPVETKVVSQSKEAELNERQNSNEGSNDKSETLEEYQPRTHQEKSPKKRNEEDYDAKSSEKKPVDGDGYKFSNYFGPSYSDSHYKGASSEHAENVDKKKNADGFSDFDEYHFKYFPEFAKQESKQEPVQESYEVTVPEATKQNVESVLAEFTKKDRSNCKKAEKKGMTCFLCVDKNNIQNEECMYVQQSKPETKHVAYHEVQATEKAKAPELPKNNTPAPEQESKLEPVTTETKNKYFFKNVPNPAPLLGLEAAASEQVGTFVRYEPEGAHKKQKRSDLSTEHQYDSDVNVKEEKRRGSIKEPKPDASAYDSERLDDKADPTIKTPEEFNVAPGEGAFSDETKAVYSKELGVQLPQYMLEKSEFEKEFDAFAGSF